MGSKAVITFKIMPESPDVDFDSISKQAEEIAKAAGSLGEMRTELEPIAFGLKAVKILAMYDVDGADFDAIIEKFKAIPQVQNAEVAKMDLALG
ncbi:elongation factor 1-beta [archaeon]|jgi:elongation factor 1-beta|nr:elongation factor 1-beta [archaeon]MBT6697893.1 elongation factor 1-beta [archaeon]